MTRGPCSTWLVALAFALSIAAASSACSDESRQCSVGADCASGTCLSNGTCAQPEGGDAAFPWGGGDSAGGDGSGGVGQDGGPSSDDAGPGQPGDTDTPNGGGSGLDAAGSGTCTPNHDGRIDRAELPVKTGLSTRYLSAQSVSFDTAGSEDDGVTTWDFSVEFAADHLELVEARALDGLWFEDDFPGATYAAKLTDAEDLLGIFRITDDALELLGVASPDDDAFTRTNLAYDPPVTVLDFPLEKGHAWSVETSVSGTYKGVVAVYDEGYEYEIDEAGVARTPFGDFEVLRVRAVLEQLNWIGIPFQSVRTFAFVSECFGTVASVRSHLDETATEFDDAAEIRRLTP